MSIAATDRPVAPLRPFAPFPRAEFEARIERARAEMDRRALDALVITMEHNFRYFSGFDSQTWVSPTRPFFLLVPLGAPPHAIIPTGSIVVMRETTWIEDVRTWPAPVIEDDGVSLLAEAIRALPARHRRVGFELGHEMHLRMPVADFLRLREMVAPIALVDGTPVTRRLRMIKSPGEVERIRHAAHLVSDAFVALPAQFSPGDTERDACLRLAIDIMKRGADRSPYLVAAAGQGGYETINIGPTDRRLEPGDLFCIDTGSIVSGYFCDFDRNFAIGRAPTDAVKRLDAALWDATEAGLAAARPGSTCSDLWHAMARSLGEEAVRGSDVGRMGHGLGLAVTEPPSVHPDDRTLLEPGMVLTLEPGIGFIGPDGRKKVLVHEENLVVTEDGCALLSKRGPRQMPVVG
jgi:Xaa-Pro aminopeptidase